MYLEDGRFVRQVFNKVQTPLIYEDYVGKKDDAPFGCIYSLIIEYLKRMDQAKETGESEIH